MALTPEEHIYNWIEAAAAIITALSLLVGFINWCQDLQRKYAIENVGSVVLDKQKMGYFVGLKNGKNTLPPVLPTLTTLLKAGDMFVYTSSILDSLATNHEEVSWKLLFEEFFKEIAWRPKLTTALTSKPTTLDPVIVEALRLSKEEVKRTAKCLPSAMTTDDTKALDRHLLYTPVRFQRSNHDEEAGFAATQRTLSACIGTLRSKYPWEAPPDFDPLLGHDKSWEEYLQPVWIHEDKPCIDVSPEELAALQFVFGMPLQLKWPQGSSENEHSGVQPNSLSGSGISGISISGYPDSREEWNLRLVISRRRHPGLLPSKGSGYSTLFAKCLGCGFLPFEQKESLTNVVQVTKTTCAGIQLGADIEDGAFATEIEQGGAGKIALNYLYNLPSATRFSYHQHVVLKPGGNSGKILGFDHEEITTWPKAVARIAFGGLVPMASLHLVRAVRFTASGGKSLGNGPLELRKLILGIQDQAKDLRLFGKYIEECVRTQSGKLVSLDPPCEATITQSSALFSRYVTLLEYITARSAEVVVAPPREMNGGPIPNPNSAAADIPAPGQGIKSEPQLAVWDCCAKALQGSYTNALKTEEERGVTGTIGEEIEDLVKKERQQLHKFTAKFCGQIARHIILAWTYYVGIVVWNDEEKAEAKVFLKGNDERICDQRICQPVDINDLPSSSFLS